MFLILMLIVGFITVITPLLVILPVFIESFLIHILIATAYYWWYASGSLIATYIHPVIMLIGVYFAITDFPVWFSIIYIGCVLIFWIRFFVTTFIRK